MGNIPKGIAGLVGKDVWIKFSEQSTLNILSCHIIEIADGWMKINNVSKSKAQGDVNSSRGFSWTSETDNPNPYSEWINMSYIVSIEEETCLEENTTVTTKCLFLRARHTNRASWNIPFSRTNCLNKH